MRERNLRTLFEKMTHFDSLDEVFLMVVAGTASINRINQLALMAPKLDPYPVPLHYQSDHQMSASFSMNSTYPDISSQLSDLDFSYVSDNAIVSD